LSAPVQFIHRQQTLWLSQERCIFWEEEKALILSDLHLGKSGHFRKSGIPVPQTVFKEDMQRLISQVQFFKPDQLIIVGDLFHSTANKEHDLFLKWRNDFPGLAIRLVMGNHDILKKKFYEDAAIINEDCEASIGPFSFTHDINDCELPSGNYIFSGHIHPGIQLYGAGKQTLRFPCFYFGNEYAVLPAFGKFTGTYLIEAQKGEAVFAILPAEKVGMEASIMRLQ
jgi:DNA ligase-associated metallophosphoesterase